MKQAARVEEQEKFVAIEEEPEIKIEHLGDTVV